MKRYPWLVPVLLALFSLAVSAYGAYARNDKEMAQRVTTVEVQQKNDGEAIDRIEKKVDRILDKMRGW